MTEISYEERLAKSIALQAKGSARTGRKCGACSLCCRLLDVPEIGKPDHGWCQHCRPGKGGCSIYQQRPVVCRAYACQWLMDETLTDDWFPLKAKIVLDFDGGLDGEPLVARFHVDPNFPNRWREEPYYSTIKTISLRGLQGADNGVRWQTIVTVKGKWTIILPHKEVPHSPGISLAMGDMFEFIPCKSEDDARKLNAKLCLFAQTVDRVRALHPNYTPPMLLQEVIACLRENSPLKAPALRAARPHKEQQ